MLKYVTATEVNELLSLAGRSDYPYYYRFMYSRSDGVLVAERCRKICKTLTFPVKRLKNTGYKMKGRLLEAEKRIEAARIKMTGGNDAFINSEN